MTTNVPLPDAQAAAADAVAKPAIATRVEAVSETLHGVRVDDPYRWLEDASRPDVAAWTAAQNAAMRAVLDAVPGRAAIEARLWQLYEIGALGVPVVKGKGKGRTLFYTRRTGKQNQPVLYVRKGATEERVLVDVNRLSASGTKSLDWWQPSEDGRKVAYGVSSDGDENSVLHVVDVASGRDLADLIPRTRAASVAWQPDGKGFYYTRYPTPGTVPAKEEAYHRHVYLHRLGADPAADRKIFGTGRDLKDWPSVALSPNGRHLVIEVSQGWTKSEVFLIDTQTVERDPNRPPTPVTVVAGKNAFFNVAEVLDDRIYLVNNDGAPRYRVHTVDPANPQPDAWKELIPEDRDILQGISVVGGTIAALYLKDASSRIRLFDRNGRSANDVSGPAEIALPGLGTAAGLSGQHDGDEIFYSYVSFLAPTTIYRHKLGRGATKGAGATAAPTTTTSEVWAKLASPIDADAFEVQQIRARSRDGTAVPMFVVHKKGLVRDGNNPTLLYGYGGFNISLSPGFTAWAAPFLEKGGVYVVANLRGGAEYGEAWHQAGMLGNKQNVFDDFIAVAEHLIAEKITSPAKLAISGRSNGGLLTSAVITQRPELFRAAIAGVPLTDMIRYHKFRIAQLWIPEYGSPDDADAFKWLHAYSPYHRVKAGVAYPAVLLFSAESDTRVDALHARKMAARLQAASTSGRPILLRLETHAGHGAGKPLRKVVEQGTDELAFLFRELAI